MQTILELQYSLFRMHNFGLSKAETVPTTRFG